MSKHKPITNSDMNSLLRGLMEYFLKFKLLILETQYL